MQFYPQDTSNDAYTHPYNGPVLWYINQFGKACDILPKGYPSEGSPRLILPSFAFSENSDKNNNFVTYNCVPFEIKYYISKEYEYYSYQEFSKNMTAKMIYNIDTNISLDDVYPLTLLVNVEQLFDENGIDINQYAVNQIVSKLQLISDVYDEKITWITKFSMMDMQEGVRLHESLQSLYKYFVNELPQLGIIKKRQDLKKTDLISSKIKTKGKGKGKPIFKNPDFAKYDATYKTMLIQKLIDNPWLMDGMYTTKIRVYVLITSLHPLQSWISKNYIIYVAGTPHSKNKDTNKNTNKNKASQEETMIIGLHGIQERNKKKEGSKQSSHRDSEYFRFNLQEMLTTGDKKLDTIDKIQNRCHIVEKNIENVLKYQIAAFHNDIMLKRLKTFKNMKQKRNIKKNDNNYGIKTSDAQNYKNFLGEYFDIEKIVQNKLYIDNEPYEYFFKRLNDRLIDANVNNIFAFHYCVDIIVDETLNVYILEINTNCAVEMTPQSRSAIVDRSLYSFNIALESLFRKQFEEKFDKTEGKLPWILDQGGWVPLLNIHRKDGIN